MLINSIKDLSTKNAKIKPNKKTRKGLTAIKTSVAFVFIFVIDTLLNMFCINYTLNGRSIADIIAKIIGTAKIKDKKSTPPAFEKKVFTAVSKKVGIILLKQKERISR